MRLLSLDFDGVLHDARAGLLPGERFVWVPLLAELLEPWPDVRLAVHSTWRYDHTDVELADLLSPMQARFIGSAPRGPREVAVQGLVHALKSRVSRTWIGTTHCVRPVDRHLGGKCADTAACLAIR